MAIPWCGLAGWGIDRPEQVLELLDKRDRLTAELVRKDVELEAWRSGRLKETVSLRNVNGVEAASRSFAVFFHREVDNGGYRHGEKLWTEEFTTIDDAVDALMAEREVTP
jgi:hypothetical protein